jgi:hypothetical protein
LYFYNARWYDPYLNRWIQPDSIILDPNNTQSYDRYAYVKNNPIRNSDPTGHFSEDQIKKFLGLSEDDPWEKVLELFEKGGKYEGRLGWLDVLKKAEIGDQITIDWGDHGLPEGHPAFDETLQFELGPQGDLILVGNDFYLDHEVAGLYGEEYELTHFETNTGKRAAAASLIIATDLSIGVPAFLLIISGNPMAMKAGEFLELSVVLPVNILGVKMWTDADREKYEVLMIQAIPDTNQQNQGERK